MFKTLTFTTFIIVLVYCDKNEYVEHNREIFNRKIIAPLHEIMKVITAFFPKLFSKQTVYIEQKSGDVSTKEKLIQAISKFYTNTQNKMSAEFGRALVLRNISSNFLLTCFLNQITTISNDEFVPCFLKEKEKRIKELLTQRKVKKEEPVARQEEAKKVMTKFLRRVLQRRNANYEDTINRKIKDKYIFEDFDEDEIETNIDFKNILKLCSKLYDAEKIYETCTEVAVNPIRRRYGNFSSQNTATLINSLYNNSKENKIYSPQGMKINSATTQDEEIISERSTRSFSATTQATTSSIGKRIEKNILISNISPLDNEEQLLINEENFLLPNITFSEEDEYLPRNKLSRYSINRVKNDSSEQEINAPSKQVLNVSSNPVINADRYTNISKVKKVVKAVSFPNMSSSGEEETKNSNLMWYFGPTRKAKQIPSLNKSPSLTRNPKFHPRTKGYPKTTLMPTPLTTTNVSMKTKRTTTAPSLKAKAHQQSVSYIITTTQGPTTSIIHKRSPSHIVTNLKEKNFTKTTQKTYSLRSRTRRYLKLTSPSSITIVPPSSSTKVVSTSPILKSTQQSIVPKNESRMVEDDKYDGHGHVGYNYKSRYSD